LGIKEGLLALLSSEPAHGYQLKLNLESAIGETWRLNVGQVYTTLQRLERDGLVASAGSDDQGRIVYRITDPGRDQARLWMTSPEELAEAGRDEISLKVLIALVSGVTDPRRVVEVQRGSTMALLQDYARLKASDDGSELAWQLYLDRLIFSAEAELRWLERVESRLEELPPVAVIEIEPELLEVEP